MSIVSTARTHLRRLNSSDLGNMLELETDPDIMKYTPSRGPLLRDRIESRLASWIEKEPDYSPLGIWVAEFKNHGNFIGWFMLLNTDLQYPELGFMIAKRQWGQGLATEISLELIRHGFNTLKLAGICARTDKANVSSIRVLEKLGMHLSDSVSSHNPMLHNFTETCIYQIRNDGLNI